MKHISILAINHFAKSPKVVHFEAVFLHCLANFSCFGATDLRCTQSKVHVTIAHSIARVSYLGEKTSFDLLSD